MGWFIIVENPQQQLEQDFVSKINRIFAILLLTMLLSSCVNPAFPSGIDSLGEDAQNNPALLQAETENPEQSTVPMDLKPKLFLADEIQSPYRDELMKRLDVEIVQEQGIADVTITPYQEKIHASQTGTIVEWLYVAAVPFQFPAETIDDWDIKRAWQGMTFKQFNFQPLLVSKATAVYFSTLWGPPSAKSVKIVLPEALLETASGNPGSWGILPFEELSPKWRILSVGGHFPLDRDLDRESYPLMARYFVHSRNASIDVQSFIGTNFDPQQMTSLLLTGTTALVRHLAFTIENEGIEYPIEEIRSVFTETDITHLSNEVPMFEACPPAVPLRVEMRFCSDPSYITLFNLLEISFVELSGNHEMDWWEDPFLETLELYKENIIPVVGGGENLTEALKPLEIEDHGNRFVFFSCNAVGPIENLATKDRAGSAPCDVEQLSRDIAAYRTRGFLPVVLFQHIEVDTIYPHSLQRIEFAELADAGAVIVSGSQAHRPQTFAFSGESLLHYGLGNTFFDQTKKPYNFGFMDRHYFYQGKYISTELLPVEITKDYQTILMPEADRLKFLTEILGSMQ
jgi:poly-gamma-glutamate synthesis protein (capsule biosynthesis protein)